MRVKLKAHITGTRNGAEWPGYGEEMELPDDEAQAMMAAGLVVAPSSKTETVPDASEARKALSPTRTVKGK